MQNFNHAICTTTYLLQIDITYLSTLLPRKPNIYIHDEDIQSCDVQIGFMVPFGHTKKDFINRFSLYFLSLILG